MDELKELLKKYLEITSPSIHDIEEKLISIQEDLQKLDALERSGVDNWIGYGEARKLQGELYPENEEE